MKKLILLLLFIPLVSIGQTTLRYDWRSDKLITVYKGNPNIAKIDYSAIRQRKILNNQQKIIRQQQEGFVNQTKILYEQIYTQNLNIEVGDKEHQDFVKVIYIKRLGVFLLQKDDQLFVRLEVDVMRPLRFQLFDQVPTDY